MTASSTVEEIQTSNLAENTFLYESLATTSASRSVTSSPSITESTVPVATGDIAEADTALVVEPIQRTVITHIIPGITFHNPEGVPVITDEPQTILSTIYITPTPAPKLDETSSASPIPSPTPSPEVASTESNNIPIASTSIPADVTSSVAAVENGTASETSQQGPMFTYSPKEETTATPVASPTQDRISNSTTAESIAPSSGALPGFNHPGSASRSVRPTGNAPISTIAPSSTLAVVESSGQPVLPAPSASDSLVDDTESTTHIYVTKTEYTTVYPSATPSVLNTTTVEPAAPTEAQNTPPGQPAGSDPYATPIPSAQPLESAALSSNSAAALPTTSLQPPVVIITQYTTVTPAPEAQPTEAPAPSSTIQPAPSIAPSAPYEDPSTSAVAQPTATPPGATSPAEPAPSSEAQVPPSPTASPPAAISSSTTEAVQPPPEPTSTSEGPLIITPIAPSQIFTVTVTETEKETVTETATVTVAARR